MQKHLARTGIVFVLGIASLGAQANAADLRGSLKDSAYATEPVAKRDLGGFGIRVFMGYSWGDRDITQTNNGEIGIRATPECRDEETEVKASGKNGDHGGGRSCEHVNEKLTEFVDHLNENGVDASWNGTTFELPLLRALSGIVGSEDISTLSGGVEAEYLVHSGALVWGVVGGVTLYADADSRTNYAGAPITLGGGALISPHGSPQVGAATGLTASGFVEVDRSVDVDLALKVGTMVNENTLLYAIAGPSFARGKVRGGVGIDGTGLAMEYEDDQWSIGYVIGAGVQHYFGNGWSANAQVDYKAHEFDASKSIDTTIASFGDAEIYGKASSKSEAEDAIWTVKAGIARHW
jgi:opacity protein-like surface antigen